MTGFLRHLFLPHHSNNFRAKILQVDFFALYIIAFLIIGISFRLLHQINPDILGFATDINVDKLVELTNKKRNELGLSTLRYDPQLSQAAAQKAADMFSKNYWAHVAPDGGTPWDFIHGVGYVYTVAGENLAKNFNDSSGVVDAWMNSPSHRENMLRPQYQDVGFAVVNGKLSGEETTLVVQMFGKRLTSATVAQNPAPAPPGIPVAPAQAQESTLIAQAQPEITVTPAPAQVQPLTAGVATVVRKPLFDLSKISKSLLLTLSTILMITLVIDTVYVWRKKIVRIGGKNFAHLLFLFAITGAVWFISFGSIL